MEVALLGPVEVRIDGAPLPITAPKERAVLALLALRAGTTVSVRALEEALWGENPPRSAAKALQTYISHLRRELPPGLIVTANGGYLLAASSEDIDAARFEALATRGRRHLADGDPVRAADALREGLALWRGEPFVELNVHAMGGAWARRLEETRCCCEEDLVDARLALGEHGALVAELEMAVASQPLRERRWAQLMLALYREARQADALAAFQRLRSVLSDELGIDPSRELQSLELAILQHDPALDAPTTPGMVMSLDALDKTGLGGALIDSRLSTADEDAPPGAGIMAQTEPAGTNQPGTAPGQPLHETQTVLFTDLVESTARAVTLGTDSADEFRRVHFAMLRGTVAAHGGALVKNLGDGIMATFVSPSAALSCAVAIQQTVDLHSRGSEPPVALRIGLSAGEVTRENGDYFGEPVIEASRLCDLAQGGEILLSELVSLLAGRHASQEFESLGPLE
ncbi:MAG TPA: BTAD domain-containing putative transcriptional regulator, partial [Acidimicrobiales bacterium]|nr:BTAD domain-containing putative transcriptional regulator [Acidimicrobiales bacterium]